MNFQDGPSGGLAGKEQRIWRKYLNLYASIPEQNWHNITGDAIQEADACTYNYWNHASHSAKIWIRSRSSGVS